MTLQNYEWTVDGRPDGKLRKAGEPVKMNETQAKYHLQMGHLKLVRKAASKPAQKARKAKAKTGEPDTAPDPASSKAEGDADE